MKLKIFASSIFAILALFLIPQVSLASNPDDLSPIYATFDQTAQKFYLSFPTGVSDYSYCKNAPRWSGTNFSAGTPTPDLATTTISASGYTDGDYYMLFGNGSYSADCTGTYTSWKYYFWFHKTGTTYTYDSAPSSTKIIQMIPENGSATTTNSVYFKLKYYVSTFDATTGTGLKVYLHNIDQNVFSAVAQYSGSDKVLLDTTITTAGEYSYSTTTTIADGNYRLYAKLSGTYGNFLGTSIVQGCSTVGAFTTLTCQEGSTQFVVNQGTFLGNISQNSFQQYGEIFASSTATSTSALASSCNVLYGFSVSECMAFLFIPDAGLMFDTLGNFRDKVATHFPLGYITDALTILNNTASSSLPILSVSLPMFGHPTLTLDPNHVLDFVLYAKATDGGYGNNTSTFYDTTNYYWSILLYILTGFYVLRRILGSHIIPHFGKKYDH